MKPLSMSGRFVDFAKTLSNICFRKLKKQISKLPEILQLNNKFRGVFKNPVTQLRLSVLQK